MPPFASTELARDSPLDELAFRHSLSSVSLSSISSNPRPSSLPILDAFPLPLNADYGSSPDSSGTSSHAGTPPPAGAWSPILDASRAGPPVSALPSASSGSPSAASPHQSSSSRPLRLPSPLQREEDARGQGRADVGSNVGPNGGPNVGPNVGHHGDPHGDPHGGHHADPHGGPHWAPFGVPHGVPHGGPQSGREVGRDILYSELRPSRHARESSTDTILPAPDAAAFASPLSRTQQRYQRYGHSYSGSQGHASPGTSPAKPATLGPTWLGLAAHSAPSSAASAVEPGFAAMAQGHAPSPTRPVRAAGTLPVAYRHARAPSQPAFRHAPSPTVPSPTAPSANAVASPNPPMANFESASPAGAPPFSNVSASAGGPNAGVGAVPPALLFPSTHGSSQSWDVGSSARVRIPSLPSAALHLREGSAALFVDSRLTLEHWAAAASRFGSAAGNLLLELGWAERWIPWTIISGLDLPAKIHEVDPTELKCGVAPCTGRVADALHSYGVRLQVRQQEAAALRAFELAESLGSTEAAFSAAHLCMKGGRQVKKDVVKARSLLRRVNDI